MAIVQGPMKAQLREAKVAIEGFDILVTLTLSGSPTHEIRMSPDQARELVAQLSQAVIEKDQQ